MDFGMSVYLTKDYNFHQNINYIDMARQHGMNSVFTSLHLPEINYEEKLDEFFALAKEVKSRGMNFTVDISPYTMNVLNSSVDNLKTFSESGVNCIRVDYGFDLEEISTMTRNEFDIKIQINASTITPAQLEALKKFEADFTRISSCHNFYPRPETGLSYKFFFEKTKLLKSFGLPVYAFIPSREGRRGPIYDGLPTLEMHRNIKPGIAARHLIYTRLIDGVYFGDAYASYSEIKEVMDIDPEIIDLSIELTHGISCEEKNIVVAPVHTNRLDTSDIIIRSEESRGYAKIGEKIKPRNTVERRAFSVTIDNEKYLRYSGELQIVLKDLPADGRVNVVGFIPEDEHILVSQINPGTKFRFRKG
ncbi:DUF871 domain-containing protein [Thermoanaerobacteraceae bacterium SP2]|nr:DUF871 domain-containing protein [Thermoanaerobacteraceae bacterium SP2]